eukprot:gene9903-2225_t
MITPKFEIEQTDDFLIIKIRTPHIKLSMIEYIINEKTFRFHVKPYFLRLTFEQEISDENTDNPENLVYNSETGEFFTNLNMLTMLMSTKKEEKKKPLIEMIEEDDEQEDDTDDLLNDDFEFFEQKINSLDEMKIEDGISISKISYGFDSRYNNFFNGYHGENVLEIIDLVDPDKTQKSDRTNLRLENESKQFSGEYYIQDFVLIDNILPLLKKSRIFNETKNLKWNDKEERILLNLPKKNFLISNPGLVYITLVDILLSYCYHGRTMSENNVESAWTLSKLSSSLSWFEEFSKIEICLFSFLRRVLTFPLYRNFDLGIECIKDVSKVLKLGKTFVLKCLLDIKDIFEHDQEKYLLNKLFIDDYCIWIQKTNDSMLFKLGDKIEEKCKSIQKLDTGYRLDVLEKIAIECQEEGAFEEDEEMFERPKEME